MSSKLWEFFIQDDVQSFRQLLANATTFAGPRSAGGPGASLIGAANLSSNIGSPGSIATSPNPSKTKKNTGSSPGTSVPERSTVQRGTAALSRAEINARDHFGRTLLHHVASSAKPTATAFALALLDVPFIDIYVQDWESGWTALHRALYAGNAAIAQALMAKDMRDINDFSKLGNASHQIGSLIKIKDRDGYSPFDVYGATITSRDIKEITPLAGWRGSNIVDTTGSDAGSTAGSGGMDFQEDDKYFTSVALKGQTDFAADEVFALGSNKNLNLGLGDQDDRQFPERIQLKRPDHLLHRFYREYRDSRAQNLNLEEAIDTEQSQELPDIIKNKPMKIQNVVMSKLHTAVITDDPEANLFMCGFGPGGRLGTGDEATRFAFVCIEIGPLAGKKIISVALGQDHSLAITKHGEIFSWGSNKFGQLGYGLPRTSSNNDVPIQTTPRQIFNPFKKETILGAAASSIHSVVFSNSGLYTFGKNEGQLGLVDSDARSLEYQTTPRRVGASQFSSPIQMVSAIDRATAVRLQNNEVWVFSQYGYTKLSFPLEASSRFIRDSFMATRYDASVNRITKIACGGNTICALASSGDVFTVEVNKSENPSAPKSTTNPAKIRNSLATPVRAWSVKRSNMAASDVDVGQDGSIIICTTSGSAWKKEKRTKNKEGASKEFKFARIPGLSRAVAVRSNAFGAYAVAQRDCDVTKEQIHLNESTLLEDILPLSPFMTPGPDEVDTIIDSSAFTMSSAMTIKRAIMMSSDIENHFLPIHTEGIIWLTSSTCDMRIPVHGFLLRGRSSVLRKALQEFRSSYYSSISDVLEVEYDKDGHTQIKFQGLDFLTVMNIAFFLYTDNILDVWHKAKTSPESTARFRQVRSEVMRVSQQLGLSTLERAARLMIESAPSLKNDMLLAINHASFFDDADTIVELNGDSVKVHSYMMCQRCPFFDALFHGRSGGQWLAMRRTKRSDVVYVDLKHIDRSIFDFVLKYIYADMEEQMFDEVRTKTLDDFIDLVLDVMYVANELMIDRLSQICQKMIGRFVNNRNISYLLNSVAPIYMRDFKDAALEYICLDLEAMLANRYLEGLDDDLLRDLDAVCHDNQLSCYPISRGRNTEAYVLEKYPEIISSVESDKRKRIDAMALKSRLSQIESYDVRPKPVANDKSTVSPSVQKSKSKGIREIPSPFTSPTLRPKQSVGDLMFQMDEEAPSTPGPNRSKSGLRGLSLGGNILEAGSYPESPVLGASIPEGASIEERRFLNEQMSSPREKPLAESPAPCPADATKETPQIPSAPWGSSSISKDNKGLKDIMGESTQSRVSNLTLEMAGRRESSGTFTQKISQKERKKMQQQQQLQEQLLAQQKAKDASRNPWQLPSSPPIPATPGKSGPLPGQSSASSPLTESSKGTQKPMTLRQTVAGTPPPKGKPIATPVQSQARSISGHMPPQSPFAKASPSGPTIPSQQSIPKASPQPSVQSVRHIPRHDPHHSGSRSPSFGSSLSLAAILEQQQTEKNEIREAAMAKHNLQEIQAEQEFQQWWDQESRRVQGLLDPEPPREEKGGRGGKSSNPSSNSRKRRGNKASNTDGTTQSPDPSKTPKNANEPVSRTTNNSSGNHVSATGSGRTARRGGHGNRGRDKG